MDFFHIYSIYVLPEGTCTRQGPARACNCVALSCASRRFTCEGCASQLGRCPNSKNISIRGPGGIGLFVYIYLLIYIYIFKLIYIYI